MEEKIEVEKNFLTQILKKQTEQEKEIRNFRIKFDTVMKVIESLEKPQLQTLYQIAGDIANPITINLLANEIKPILVKYGVANLIIKRT